MRRPAPRHGLQGHGQVSELGQEAGPRAAERARIIRLGEDETHAQERLRGPGALFSVPGGEFPEPQPRCLLWTAPLIARGILSPSHSWAEPLPERYMAASSIPYLDVAAGGVERGLSCRGCQVAWDDEMEDETEERSGLVMSQVVWNYSREGFLEHFRECDEAQALWSASKGGTVPLEEPEVTMEERYGEL